MNKKCYRKRISDPDSEIQKLQQINKELITQLEIMTNWCESIDDSIDWFSMFSCKSDDLLNAIKQSNELITKAKEVTP